MSIAIDSCWTLIATPEKYLSISNIYAFQLRLVNYPS